MAFKGSCDDLGCWVGELLRGCELCMKGAKSVVFVTGVCPEKCFYCPLSPSRKNRDLMYVNEVRATSLTDIVLESIASGSEGAGITGGDPLARIDRTLSIIKGLKEFFGSHYHIHLYTTGILLNDAKLRRLVDAGLDELRIHVVGDHSWKALEKALEFPLDVAIENPVLPGSENLLRHMIAKAVDMGVKYVNLNELEFSEGNYESMLMRGYSVRDDGVAAEGSKETALEIMRWVIDEGLPISVHFCPARYKDKYQFRRRMARRAVRTRMVYEDVDDGLVRWLKIDFCDPDKLKELIAMGLAFKVRDGVVTSTRVTLPFGCKWRVVEAYPTTPRRVLNESSAEFT